MNASEIIKSIEAEQLKAEVPEFRVGDTVKVYGKIKEGNRERIQVFEGVVIKRQGGSNRETFTVRKISNGCGVEKTWPLHSPNVEKVEVVRAGKVRRAKLFYLRDRVGKKAKVKELVKQFNACVSHRESSRFFYGFFIFMCPQKKYTKIYDVSYEKLAMFYIDKFFEGGGRMGLVFKG